MPVTLFGAQLVRRAQTQVPAVAVQKLHDQIKDLRNQIKQQQDLKAVLAQEKRFIDSFQFYSEKQLPKELVTKMPDPGEMDGMLKFIGGRLKDNYSGVMDADLKISDLEDQIVALEQELAKVSGPLEKETKMIVVELESAKPGVVDVVVSYLIRAGAFWQPVYDARASFEKSEIELVCYGLVTQNSGEDWVDVSMSLSTASPSVGGNLPYVAPWILRPVAPRQSMPMRAMRNKSDMNMEMKMMAQSDAFSGGAPREESLQVAEVSYAQAQERGTSIVYALDRSITVKADGSQHKLPIFTDTLKAVYEYSTYPRAVTLAYLGSRVTNSEIHQILPGSVSIFLDGEYVGVSELGQVAPSETFDLYLGADESVKVARQLVEKKVDETILGLPSASKVTTFVYKMTVENYKAKPAKVKLFESMPVSENDKIKVKVSKVTVEPTTKDWETRKGVWLWEMTLQPKEKKEILYTFTVEHPKDVILEGL
jgi:uncharacterized protein (TIGR02231 family)